jgi:IclR family acetate operon transcriptional repressor
MSKATPIKLLANATDVISLLAHDGPLSPAEIADRSGLPRSSVYRLVEGLSAISMAELLPDSRVRLTSRWLHLADATRDGMEEWDAAPAILQRLVENTGQTAYLTVPRELTAVCIEWRQGRGIDVLALKPGRSLPLYAGAAGRTILAFGKDLDAVLESAPFTPMTPGTLVTAAALREDVATTLAQGYAVSDEDVTIGISAIGVPILAADGTLRGCVSIGGIAEEFRAKRDDFVRELRLTAEAIASS